MNKPKIFIIFAFLSLVLILGGLSCARKEEQPVSQAPNVNANEEASDVNEEAAFESEMNKETASFEADISNKDAADLEDSSANLNTEEIDKGL